MLKCRRLTSYLNQLLQPNNYQDYCPNGLQVAGKEDINKIITGVSICQKLIDAAVKTNAEVILVHHGLFWQGEDPCIVGIKKQRIKQLLTHDINLIAYHLPLDYHAEYGNNVQLAKLLDIEITSQEDLYMGTLKTAMLGTDFALHLQQKLHNKPIYIPGKNSKIKTIAWCTGAAQDYIEQAAEEGADAYLTGEISERSVYIARETGVHLFAAGHYATERYGVKALGHHLAAKFDTQCQFVEIDNSV